LRTWLRVQGFGFRVSGFGFRVSGFGIWVSGFGFRAAGSRFRASGCGFRVSGFGFRVSSFGFRISAFRFRVSGFGFRVTGFGFRFSVSGFWGWVLGLRFRVGKDPLDFEDGLVEVFLCSCHQRMVQLCRVCMGSFANHPTSKVDILWTRLFLIQFGMEKVPPDSRNSKPETKMGAQVRFHG